MEQFLPSKHTDSECVSVESKCEHLCIKERSGSEVGFKTWARLTRDRKKSRHY